MAFHEVRLPARLAFGSTGGVERRTEIVTLGSGFERRSTPWAMGRRRYLIGANLRSVDDMAALTGFFEARRGRLYGFRFRDFADCKSCGPGAAVGPLDQELGEGDGTRTMFQLVKRYGEGADGLDEGGLVARLAELGASMGEVELGDDDTGFGMEEAAVGGGDGLGVLRGFGVEVSRGTEVG
jgi:hypothetical protein